MRKFDLSTGRNRVEVEGVKWLANDSILIEKKKF